jgi:hypothetical protein
LENAFLKGGTSVKNFIRIGGIILIAFSVLLSSTWTFASEEGISKTQGRIMGIDFKKNIMVVNEKTFIWNKSTIFNNDKESVIGIEKFKTKSWVFIEGEPGDKNTVIKRIYLLPKHVGKKERHLYPFMQ